LRNFFLKELEEAETEFKDMDDPLPDLTYHDAKFTHQYMHNTKFRENYEQYNAMRASISSLRVTISMLNRALAKRAYHIVSESETCSFPFRKDARESMRRVRGTIAIVGSLKNQHPLNPTVVDFHHALKTSLGDCNIMLNEIGNLTSVTSVDFVMCDKLLNQMYSGYNWVVAFFEQSNWDFKSSEILVSIQIELDYVLSIIVDIHDQMDMLDGSMIVSESEDIAKMQDGPISGSQVVTRGNITDVAGDVYDEEKYGSSNDVKMLVKTVLPLDGFFSRPVQLAELSLDIGDDLDYQTDIWKLYFSVPSIRAKLKNYAFIRANLNIRVAISGTPFHRGKVMSSYIPHARNNEVASFYMANFSTFRGEAVRYLSTTNGRKTMDVKDNAPLDMKLEFVGFQPVIRLFNNSAAALSDAVSYADTDNLGVLFLTSLNSLVSVSPTPTNVSIYVYGWLSEVELGCPTGTVITVVTESADERKVGPVEKFSTSAASAMGVLSQIPVISPYAKASQMALTSLSNISAMFGWAVPTMITEPHRMKNEPYQNGSQTIGYDTGKRITLDPKQELTVDPRFVARDRDELSIAFLCSIESLLDQLSWSHDTSPLQIFWKCVVNPRVCVARSHPGKSVFQPSSLMFAASPFSYWRGTIVYKIEIVATAFHRGKIGVGFDPNVSQSVLMEADQSLNKQFLKIVDIQETQTFEICVEWAHSKPWARVCNDTQMRGSVGGITDPAIFRDFANGYIFLFPITKLQSPDNSDVSINVYIRSDDMVFNFMNTQLLPSNMVVAESETIPRDLSCLDLNPSGQTKDHLADEYFGEVPTSFRSLMKRFVTDNTLDGTTVGITGQAVVKLVDNSIPKILPIFNINSTFNTERYTLLGYLRYAYIAMRGGLRRRVSFPGLELAGGTARVKVALNNPSDTTVATALSYANSVPSTSSMTGSVMYIPSTNGGVEFEVPFYSNNLFVPSGTTAPFDQGDPMFCSWGLRNYSVTVEAKGGNTFNSIVEIATGEDFILAGYIAPPPFAISDP